MDKLPSFQSIENFSELVEDNELFSQFSNENIANHYDSNYVQLYINPTLAEFQLLEAMHLNYQHTVQQKHLKFHWPENIGLFVDVLNYISLEGYEMGKLELFQLTPENFVKQTSNLKVKIVEVTEDTIEVFLMLNYNEDIEHDKDFAEHKQDVYRYQFACDHVTFFIASIDQRPVGSLILISSSDFLEVDNVLTVSSWRKKGIATEMLDYVKTNAETIGKDVILLADAEDSPREMYLKLGFQPVASQIHVLKKL